MSKQQTAQSCREDIGMLPCPLYSRVVTIEKAIEEFTIAFVLQRLKFFATSF
ncbi:hypothetical protein LC653_45520 [Nostoc sp. CHAB 5784]|uniref:hypothetical protein n=1 Tax=Nostoc mirabile TaxID=2907820 RepID=UPI001E5C68B2|nr:hypothetical protein [Nostoc mirabile]MCC5670825.1 hypothetical protein [Nostoc mirabile CHAB5784]